MLTAMNTNPYQPAAEVETTDASDPPADEVVDTRTIAMFYTVAGGVCLIAAAIQEFVFK